MNNQQPKPELAATLTAGPFTAQDGRPALRPDIEKLQRDVIIESVECLVFLQENPDHAPFTQGTVLLGCTPNPDEWIDLTDDAMMIPQYADNIRQWSIPNTPWSLTDLGADIVTTDETNRFPHVVDPISFTDIAKLEQLIAGLRALRA